MFAGIPLRNALLVDPIPAFGEDVRAYFFERERDRLIIFYFERDDIVDTADVRDDLAARLQVHECPTLLVLQEGVSIHDHDERIAIGFRLMDAGKVPRMDGIEAARRADNRAELVASIVLNLLEFFERHYFRWIHISLDGQGSVSISSPALFTIEP